MDYQHASNYQCASNYPRALMAKKANVVQRYIKENVASRLREIFFPLYSYSSENISGIPRSVQSSPVQESQVTTGVSPTDSYKDD